MANKIFKNVLFIGSNNRVGNIDFDDEMLKQILEESEKKVISAFEAMDRESFDRIAALLDAKMTAQMYQVSLNATHTENYIQNNFESFENKLSSVIEEIKKGLSEAQDKDNYLAEQARIFSSQMAEAVLQFNKIEESLHSIGNTTDQTYAQILIQGAMLQEQRNSINEIKTRLEERDAKDETLRNEILKLWGEVYKTIRDKQVEKAKDITNYDRICYERMDGISQVKTAKGIILKRVDDSNLDAAGMLNEIKNEFDTFKKVLLSETDALKILLKEESRGLHDSINDVIKKLQGTVHQHGEDCVRCGAPEARIYKCDICDSMPGESDGSSATVWGSDWWDGEGLMMVRGEGFENQTVNLRNYKTRLPVEMIQRIIFDTDVREIYCQDMDMGVPQYQNICELFPNLKCLALRKPSDGQEKEYCILGESLFSGCGHLRLYGMKYVKDLKPHCFAKWGITDENHNEFIDKYFSKNLHSTLSAKGTRRKDWRT